MGLVTPFDSSFWSTEEAPPSPEERSAKKQADYNQKMWGSPSVSVKYDSDGHQVFWSGITGNGYGTAAEAVADEAAYKQDPRAWAQANSAAAQQMTAATGAQTPVANPNAPTNQILDGLGIYGSPGSGAAPAAPVVDTRSMADRLAQAAPRPGFTNELGAFPAATARTIVDRPRTASPYDQFPGVGGAPGAGGGSGPSIDTSNPGSPAPTVDRTKIDAILNPLGNYNSAIADLATDNTGQSVAEAQLMKADQLAKIRARDQLAANQAGAMGAARSARNRGDRALLERQAVGEQAYLGSQAQRQDVLQQAELEGNLAQLRAQEEDYDRRFKLDALKTASDLGLNRAALEVDIGKTDLASSTNWINNEFEQLALDKKLSADEKNALLVHDDARMQQILGFTQAMAAIQYQYDQLGVQDQNAADQLLMQKYNIDQQTLVALKKIKEENGFHWDRVLSSAVGAAVSGGTSIIGDAITSGNNTPGGG